MSLGRNIETAPSSAQTARPGFSLARLFRRKPSRPELPVSPDRGPFAPHKFYVQRGVIHSGSPVGFFENERIQEVLDASSDKAQPVNVPHVTVVETGLAKAIMAKRPEVSRLAVMSECRKVIDGLPDRIYGHVGEIALFGRPDQPRVALTLESRTEKVHLGRDVETISGHFGLPFNNDNVYVPHVSLFKTDNVETAQQIAHDLNTVMESAESPEQMALAFGGLTVIRN